MFVNRDSTVSYYMISFDSYTVREYQFALSGLKLKFVVGLGPVYVEIGWPSKKGHPSIRGKR